MLRWIPLLAALLPLAALAGPRHPAVAPARAAEACESCHAEVTPAPVKQWEAGKHGLVLVKCFVCHGSTGKDFALRPAADRCAGCHPEQVATPRLVPATSGKGAKGADCFACHDPHSLAVAPAAASPHGAR